MLPVGLTTLNIPIEYSEKVLLAAGYKKHWKGNGYVRDLTHKKRWHAFIEEDKINFHLDRTNENNMHFVEKNWLKIHSIERKRIRSIWYQKFDPIRAAKREEKILRRLYHHKMGWKMYADNLQELQKHGQRPL